MLYRLGKWLFRVFFTVFYRVRVLGRENIPIDGAVVLCGNHISAFDPPLMGCFLERKVHYMAKAELFDKPVLGPIISRLGAFPVKRGGVSRESIRLAISILKEGNVMGIFPEGTRSNSGGIGQKGAASLALKSNATVVPVAIIGPYSLFKPLTIVYGKPLDISEYAGASSEDLELATDRIMSVIRNMVAQHSKV